MQKSFYTLLSLYLIGMCVAVFAQDVEQKSLQLLNLGDAISIALEKSYEMKVARLDKLAAEKNLISAKSNFKLRMDANFDLPSASEQVQETYREGNLPVYETRGNYRYQGNLNITQPLPTNGRFRLQGQTYYGSVSYWDYGQQSTLRRTDVLTSLNLQFYQPLFTLNDLKVNLKRADLRYESAERRYKREELDIIYQVTSAFYAYYRATRELEIANENVKRQQELAELAQQKYNAGLIPEVEALQLQVDFAQSRNAKVAAEAALVRMSDMFKQLIGLQFSDNVGVLTSFEMSKVDVALDHAIKLAKENRSEVRLSEIDVELAQIDVKETDAIRDFNGTLSAFYDITGVANSDVWNTSKANELWKKSLDDMDQRPDNRGVVFSLSIPIWDFGGNRAAVQSAEANLRTQELALAEMKKTIEREVRDVVGRLREAESQLEVLEQRQDIADRAYEISVERFNNGDITSQELALDRDRYIDAQVSYLDSYINYQLALADLKRTTMYDYEHGHSLVE
ncbi:TolC family protein [candidate division KSB1 bacterium]|nr:TolC family protein [candidate division KSB1 bacterium]RQW00885.1 MAG: TolC family protein [candidate division KSB1 bacterium]